MGVPSARSSISSVASASAGNLKQVEWAAGGLSLDAAAKSLRETVVVADRVYRLKKYERTFVGSDAARALVSLGFAASLAEAVQLGTALAQQGFLRDVSVDGLEAQRLENSYKLYRFTQDERILQLQDILPAGTTIADVRAKFLEAVPKKDRRQGLRMHRGAFLGIEGVNVILKLGYAQTRADAAHVCQGLLDSFCFVSTGSPSDLFSDSVQLYKVRDALVLDDAIKTMSEVSSPFTPRIEIKN